MISKRRSLETDRIEMVPVMDLLESQVEGKKEGRVWVRREEEQWGEAKGNSR